MISKGQGPLQSPYTSVYSPAQNECLWKLFSNVDKCANPSERFYLSMHDTFQLQNNVALVVNALVHY